MCISAGTLVLLGLLSSSEGYLRVKYWPEQDVVHVAYPWGQSRFSCQFESDRNFTVEWRFRGQKIDVDEFSLSVPNPIFRIYADGSGGTVDQWPPAFSMSNGTYECIARNGFDPPVSRKMEQVPVPEEEFEKRGGPSANFWLGFETDVQFIGENYTMHCNGSGPGNLQIRWYWDDVPIHITDVLESAEKRQGGWDRYHQSKMFTWELKDNNRTLTIFTHGKIEHIKFDCIVANEFGMASAGHLLVLNRARHVKVVYVAPKITSGPANVTVDSPEQWISVHCNFTAHPSADLRWYFEDEPFAEDFSPLSFVAMRSGVIKCVVKNPAGEDSATSYLHVTPVPYHGLNVKVVNQTSTSILLFYDTYDREAHWHKGIPVTHAIFDYRSFKFDQVSPPPFQQRRVEIPAYVNEGWYYNWTGLQPWTWLEFRVRFGNKYGVGKPSYDWIRGYSDWDVVKDPVWNLSVQVHSNESFTVYWKDPAVTNGPVKEYYIYLAREPDQPLNKWELFYAEQGASSYTHNYTGNAFYDGYAITWWLKIRIVGFKNDGPMSETISFRCVPGAPGHVTNATAYASGPRSITLFWNATLDAGSGIVGYTVLYNRKDQQKLYEEREWSRHDTHTPLAMNATITELHPFREYELRVYPRSRSFIGVPSPTLTVKTLEAAPTHSPVDLRAVARTSTSIEVFWNPPPAEHLNSYITGYRVYYTRNEVRAPEVSALGPETTHLVLQGLGKFTRYLLWVTYSNRLGEGPPSKQITVITNEDAPDGAPQSMQVFTLNSTAVLVSWLPPRWDQRSGRIRGYKIFFKWIVNGKQYEPYNIVTVDGFDSSSREIGFDLNPKTDYRFQVAAFTNVGTGPMSNEVVVTMPEVLGKAPETSVEVDPVSHAVTVSWYPLTAGNNQYRVTQGKSLRKFGLLTDIVVTFHTLKVRSLTFNDLDRGVWYCFKVAAKHGEPKAWSSDSMRWVKTADSAPSGPPTYFEAVTESASTIRLMWEEPEPWKRHGEIRYYVVTYSTEKSDFKNVSESRYDLVNNEDAIVYILFDLLPDTRYRFTVKAFNDVGPGPETIPIETRTNRLVLPMVSNLRSSESDSRSIYLAWDDPVNTDKFLDGSKFLVTFTCSKTYRDEAGAVKVLSANESAVAYSRQFLLQDLTPAVEYLIVVRVETQEAGVGDPVHLSVKTEPDVPPVVYPPVWRANSSAVLTDVSAASEINGPINHYILFVVDIGVDPSRRIDQMRPGDFDLTSRSRRLRRSVALNYTLPVFWPARFFYPADLPSVFTVGDGRKDMGFENHALTHGHSYVAFLRAYVRQVDKEGKARFVFKDSPFSEALRHKSLLAMGRSGGGGGGIMESLWIIGVAAGGALVIVAVVLIVICRRRKADRSKGNLLRKKSKRGSANVDKRRSDPTEIHRLRCNNEALQSHPPVPVHMFAAHVDALKANAGQQFLQEFESIENGRGVVSEAALQPQNQTKNRYPNMLPYEATRVKLDFNGRLCSDYINANYIDGYCQEKAYIATQAPMKATLDDFWRMCWEQNVQAIVMVSQHSEVKCVQYWPSDVSSTQTYGAVKVELKETLSLSNFVIRTFSLSHAVDGEQRAVKHFQFTSWPDTGVPLNPGLLLAFRKRVRDFNPPGKGPWVVHCTAGVGRTACFIAIDAMLERMKSDNLIDVYGFVAMMRSQRQFMVQTDEQYIFIHDVLVEAIESGDTEIPSSDLTRVFVKLCALDERGRESGIEAQFRSIAVASAKMNGSSLFVAARLSANESKNCCQSVVPFDWSRVTLSVLPLNESSDYINASFISGYHEKGKYIAAQSPLRGTVADFWRMIVEKDCSTIVTLTDGDEKGQSFQYWPSAKPVEHYYYIIDPVLENRYANFCVREFTITDARDGKERRVRQYHCMNWVQGSEAASSEAIIEVIGHVQKAHNKAELKGPIVVHSRTGAGRTGVFIALSIALESLRTERLVDIYQIVKGLRCERPYMVQTLEQYEFCYRVASDFLKNFDLEV